MKRRWLLLGVYKPSIQSDSEFTEEIIKILNHYILSYENIILLGDLNMTTENLHLNNLGIIYLENDAYSAFSSVFRVPINEHAPPKIKIPR